ncbi:MAG TPA: hypothetical protein VFQ80_04205, partial [Thermomicrobiales bacterium]|nr:hypothetical protein [Thermomicrobiales bacterium]
TPARGVSVRCGAPRRAAFGALVAGASAALFAPPAREAAGKQRRRNTCRGKTWRLDRSHTCGPAGGHGKCLAKAYGGNVCAETLFQAAKCADCEPPNCTDCLCAPAAGGGDHCNNGASSPNDFICVRA